eukprot:Sdes_comp18703_c0_seq2m9009
MSEDESPANESSSMDECFLSKDQLDTFMKEISTKYHLNKQSRLYVDKIAKNFIAYITNLLVDDFESSQREKATTHALIQKSNHLHVLGGTSSKAIPFKYRPESILPIKANNIMALVLNDPQMERLKTFSHLEYSKYEDFQSSHQEPSLHPFFKL